MNSGIVYTGRVTVKIKNKPVKTTHNTGTSEFFQALYKILAQQVTTGNQKLLVTCLPTYMNIVTKDKGSVILTEMPISKREAGLTDVSFTCLLNNSNMKPEFPVGDEDEVTVQLLSDEKKVFATVEIEAKTFSQVKSNAYGQASLTWSMQFSNSESNGGDQ